MVVYDGSPEAERALTCAIELARMLGAELRLVTVCEPLPAYVAFADAGFPKTLRSIMTGAVRGAVNGAGEFKRWAGRRRSSAEAAGGRSS
jgi:nucleotide-binding universal stress UspA family protein